MNSLFLLSILPILVSGAGHGNLTNGERAENLRTCGISDGHFRKMLNGQNVSASHAPWLIRFRINSRWCTGNLISLRHVLVSGHCFERTVGDASQDSYCNGVNKIHAKPFYNIAIGYSNGKIRYSTQYGVRRAIWLGGCLDNSENAHDVMIMELTANLSPSNFVRPICVPEDLAFFNRGDLVSVVGFDSNSTLPKEASIRTTADVRTWTFTVTEFNLFHQYTVTSPMVSLTEEDAGSGHVVTRNGRKYLAGMTVTPRPYGALASLVGPFHKGICLWTNAC